MTPPKNPTKLLRRVVPSILAFLFTASIARRAQVKAPAALLSSTLIAAIAAVVSQPSPSELDNFDWMDSIQAIAKIVSAFSEGLSGPSPNIFLDASLQRLLHSHHSTSSKSVARRASLTERNLLVSARTYLDFALATYGFFLLKISGVIEPQYNILLEGARGIDVAKYMLRLNDDDIIIHQLDGERIEFPRYFAALDHHNSSIVIAIRGTNSISDVITDLLCGNASFEDGYAHSGMLSAARQIYNHCLPTVQKAVEETGYCVVVTGHSLGSGVGALLTKMLLSANVNTQCFAYAPPPVFGPKQAIDSKWSTAVKVFIHEDDLVARLCFASAKQLALEIGALAAVGSGQVKRALIDAGDIMKIREAVKELSETDYAEGFEALYHPAKSVHWLLPTEEKARGNFDELPPAYIPRKRYESFTVSTDLFERVLVTAPCVVRHMVSAYTRAFAGLDLPRRDKLPPPERKNYGRAWYANEIG